MVLIPDDEREFSAQLMQALRPEILIKVQCDLAVGARAQTMARSFELALDVLVAVELTVRHDLTAPVLTGDGLTARREIDDAEPRVSESDALVGRCPMALSIGTTMEETARRALHASFGDGFPSREDSDDSTHSL